MSNNEIYLALPGDLVPDSKFKDINVTRIGGPPVYSKQCQAPDVDKLRCKSCNAHLALLLSSHAPIDSSSVESAISNRYLYVYGCVAKDCTDSSWQAHRCQWAESLDRKQNSNSADDKTRKESASKPSQSSDGWGFDQQQSDNTSEPATTASGFDFGDLCSALDALQPAPKTSESAKPKTSTEEPLEGRNSDTVVLTDMPRLPSFYLIAQLENELAKKPKPQISETSNESIEYAQQQYLNTASPSVKNEGTNSDSDQQEQWDGEGYEADNVLVPEGRAGADTSYLKFAQRLWKCPDQCARYGFGGQLLWPNAALPEPGVCVACGAPRVFEVQLMAPVISYIEESAEWLTEDKGNDANEAICRPPASWEWATVAVFTCSKSCIPKQGCFVDEYVAIAKE